jgi:hypothetical protein
MCSNVINWILTERFWVWGIVREVDMRHAHLDKLVTFVVLLLRVFSIQREHPYEYWAIRWHVASHEKSEDGCCMEIAMSKFAGIDFAQNGNFATAPWLGVMRRMIAEVHDQRGVQSPRFIGISTYDTNPNIDQINVT